MAFDRISIALNSGAFTLPSAGEIVLMRPTGPLPEVLTDTGRLCVVQSFRPAHDAYHGAGLRVMTEPPANAAATLIEIGRSRALNRQMIRTAVAMTDPGGIIALDGAKTDGVEGNLKSLRLAGISPETSPKAHGRAVWFTNRSGLADDLPEGDIVPPNGFHTVPGVFSAEKIDAGSALLGDHLTSIRGDGADFGAGWGYLAQRVLDHEGVRSLDLIEAEKLSLDCAAQNIRDPRARLIWADATAHQGGPYDFIVMNPPFHTSRRAEPALGQAFIRNAARCLSRKGALWMVSNRQLPYEETLSACFQRVERLAERDGFKLFVARAPR